MVGAARGIGRAIAETLSDHGHRVTGTWHTTEPPRNGPLRWERCDITVPADVDRLFEQGGTGGEPFEIVIASSAIVRDRLSSRMSDQDFEAVLAVNLTGTFRVCRAALDPMSRRRWGRLILISSVGGWYGLAGQANYAASKAGLLGMARSLAHEVAPRGVTVNVVAPGSITTELTDTMPATFLDRWLRLVPLGRMGRSEEVASAVAFLASERAGFTTGTLVAVDGGGLV